MSDPSNIVLNGGSIQISEQEKLLRINIDSTLSWHPQTDKTIKKCNALLLGRIKEYLPIPVRKLFYDS